MTNEQQTITPERQMAAIRVGGAFNSFTQFLQTLAHSAEEDGKLILTGAIERSAQGFAGRFVLGRAARSRIWGAPGCAAVQRGRSRRRLERASRCRRTAAHHAARINLNRQTEFFST